MDPKGLRWGEVDLIYLPREMDRGFSDISRKVEMTTNLLGTSGCFDSFFHTQVYHAYVI
jgi:hypothetical protein